MYTSRVLSCFILAELVALQSTMTLQFLFGVREDLQILTSPFVTNNKELFHFSKTLIGQTFLIRTPLRRKNFTLSIVEYLFTLI